MHVCREKHFLPTKYIPIDHMFNQINNSKSNFIQVYLCHKKKNFECRNYVLPPQSHTTKSADER
jgi:hypothetical protein